MWRFAVGQEGRSVGRSSGAIIKLSLLKIQLLSWGHHDLQQEPDVKKPPGLRPAALVWQSVVSGFVTRFAPAADGRHEAEAGQQQGVAFRLRHRSGDIEIGHIVGATIVQGVSLQIRLCNEVDR